MSLDTADKFLGGKVTVRQPAQGFRSGLDSVLLAAAVPSGGEALELGSGAGVAALCLAARAAACSVTGIEIDADLVAMAETNARQNELASRVRFVLGDVLSLPPGLKREFAHVYSNPPFHDEKSRASPDGPRDRARRDGGRLAEWLILGLKRVVSGGTFTAILRADRLAETLAVMPPQGVAICPLWPRAGEPAKRVILQWRKASHGPQTLLPGLVLHEADGRFTAAADAILRDGAALALDKPRL